MVLGRGVMRERHTISFHFVSFLQAEELISLLVHTTCNTCPRIRKLWDVVIIDYYKVQAIKNGA